MRSVCGFIIDYFWPGMRFTHASPKCRNFAAHSSVLCSNGAQGQLQEACSGYAALPLDDVQTTNRFSIRAPSPRSISRCSDWVVGTVWVLQIPPSTFQRSHRFLGNQRARVCPAEPFIAYLLEGWPWTWDWPPQACASGTRFESKGIIRFWLVILWLFFAGTPETFRERNGRRQCLGRCNVRVWRVHRLLSFWRWWGWRLASWVQVKEEGKGQFTTRSPEVIQNLRGRIWRSIWGWIPWFSRRPNQDTGDWQGCCPILFGSDWEASVLFWESWSGMSHSHSLCHCHDVCLQGASYRVPWSSKYVFSMSCNTCPWLPQDQDSVSGQRKQYLPIGMTSSHTHSDTDTDIDTDQIQLKSVDQWIDRFFYYFIFWFYNWLSI